MKLKRLFENKQPINLLAMINEAIHAGKRDPVLEELLLQREFEHLLFKYTKHVIKGRWPEAEPIIMKNPQYAYYYAHYIIKGVWPEAEPYIIKDAEYSFQYAMNVKKERWHEIEPFILLVPRLACRYAGGVIKGRWPELEEKLENNAQYKHFYNQYLHYVPAARKIIKTDYLILGRLHITDIPNSITDDQVGQVVKLLFPFVNNELLYQIKYQRQYDKEHISRFFQTYQTKTTLTDIRDDWDIERFLNAIDRNVDWNLDRTTDFE